MPESDEEPLVFRYRMTEEDNVAACQCDGLVSFPCWMRWLVRGILVLAIGALTLCWFVLGLEVFILVGIILCLYSIFLLSQQGDSSYRRYYAKRIPFCNESEVRLTSNRLVVNTDDIRMDLAWRTVWKVVECPGGIIFYNHDWRPFTWLPARLLEKEGIRERIISLASSNGVKVRRL